MPVNPLVIHEKVKDRLLPGLARALREKNVEIRADEQALPLMEGAVPATEEDWGKGVSGLYPVS